MGRDGRKIKIDIGETEFNLQFHRHRIIKRECDECRQSHKEIYYKRMPDPGDYQFNAYNYMRFWKSENNLLGKNFNLFSTLEDALHDRNPWKVCNYDDVPGVGAFRDCGPTQLVGCEWTSDVKHGGFGVTTHQTCAKSAKFSILFDVRSMGCPPGSKMVNNPQGFNDISGCGLQGCDHRYEVDYRDIHACKQGCDLYSANHPGKHCAAYSWAPIAGDKNHHEHSVCTLYDSAVPTQLWGPTQVFCKQVPGSGQGYHNGGGSNGESVQVKVKPKLQVQGQQKQGGDELHRGEGHYHQQPDYGEGMHQHGGMYGGFHQNQGFHGGYTQNMHGHGQGGYGHPYGQQQQGESDSSDEQQGGYMNTMPILDVFILYGGIMITCLCLSGIVCMILGAIGGYFITKKNQDRSMKIREINNDKTRSTPSV